MELSHLIKNIDEFNNQFDFLETIPVFCGDEILKKYDGQKLNLNLMKEIVKYISNQLIYIFSIVDGVINKDDKKTQEYNKIMINQGYFKEKPQDLYFQEKNKLLTSSLADLIIIKKMNIEQRVNALSAYLCYGLLYNYCLQGLVLNEKNIENIKKDIYSRTYTLLEHVDNVRFIASLLAYYNKKIGG